MTFNKNYNKFISLCASLCFVFPFPCNGALDPGLSASSVPKPRLQVINSDVISVSPNNDVSMSKNVIDRLTKDNLITDFEAGIIKYDMSGNKESFQGVRFKKDIDFFNAHTCNKLASESKSGKLTLLKEGFRASVRNDGWVNCTFKLRNDSWFSGDDFHLEFDFYSDHNKSMYLTSADSTTHTSPPDKTMKFKTVASIPFITARQVAGINCSVVKE